MLFYPDTEYPIRPSSVSISGTTATIQVPRCRFLLPNHWNADYSGDDNDRPQYNDDANFLVTVDVARQYVDTTTGVNIVWNRNPSEMNGYCLDLPNSSTTIPVGGDVRQLVAPYIADERMGFVTHQPATYNSSTATWTKKSPTVKRTPNWVEINHMRGKFDLYEEMDSSIITAIIKVAHNNMPEDYCGCSVQHRYWEDDNRPLEPPVNLSLGQSTWGIYEAAKIFKEYDRQRMGGYQGGLL